MADIRSYMKEKEKRERKQAGYKEKIMRHKLAGIYRILLVIAAAAALVVLLVVQYKRHIYTDYDIVNSASKENIGGAVNVRLGSSILTYSKDGAHCTDARGNVAWNQTYQMQDVLYAVCGDTVAIGDYNGRNIYVQNAGGQLGQITTTMPIRNLTVAQNGSVTAVLADTDAEWINTYDTKGELLYYGDAHMNDSGYPAALSISPNGELLCVAYAYVDAGVLKTNVAFYNFGEVGENYSDFMVGIYIYTDLFVPYVKFMNDSTAFAVGDGRLSIYSGSQKPMEIAGHIINEEIQSVFYSDKYIGLVFRSDVSGSNYRMDVYDTSAVKVGSYYFNTEYTDIFFGTDTFVAYNETECTVMTLGGIEKFHGSFDKAVSLMLPAAGAYRYILVTEDSIDTIQLK